VATAFRYSSLASLVASFLTPFAFWYFGDLRTALLMAALVAVLYFKHWPNIVRLLAGTEGRIGQKG
jgi:glycerol-3-phosphate acyltransferase PlsY